MEKFEIEQKLKEFLREYKYDEGALAIIEKYFFKCLEDSCIPIPDIVYQIYSYLGIVPNTPYDDYIELMKKYFPIESMNIVEVACGLFPALAYKIDGIQTKGTITVYDPNLVVTKLARIQTIPRIFSRFEDVSSFNLIIGTKPCGATETIITRALVTKKELFLALCEDVHYKYHQASLISQISYEKWLDYLYEIIWHYLDTNEFDFNIDYFSSKYGTENCPILSIVRK